MKYGIYKDIETRTYLVVEMTDQYVQTRTLLKTPILQEAGTLLVTMREIEKNKDRYNRTIQ